jgi:hypothetical protein
VLFAAHAAHSQEEARAQRPPVDQQPGGAELPDQGKGTAMRIRQEMEKANIALRAESSYAPVATEADLGDVMKKMQAEKPKLEQRHRQLLEARYDLGDRPVSGVTMSRRSSMCSAGSIRAKRPRESGAARRSSSARASARRATSRRTTPTI